MFNKIMFNTLPTIFPVTPIPFKMVTCNRMKKHLTSHKYSPNKLNFHAFWVVTHINNDRHSSIVDRLRTIRPHVRTLSKVYVTWM